jgi:hypothetical protein
MSIESRAFTEAGFTYDQWQNLPGDQKQRVRQDYQRATLKELTDLLSDCANSDVILPQLAKNLANQHRTLVQCFMRNFIVPFIKELADQYKQGFFDLRNEQSCKLSTKMLDLCEDHYLPLV